MDSDRRIITPTVHRKQNTIFEDNKTLNRIQSITRINTILYNEFSKRFLREPLFYSLNHIVFGTDSE